MVLSPPTPVFWKPPQTAAPGGGERVVGVELEFAGLDMEAIAEIIAGVYGGRLERKDVWSGKVRGTSLAEFGDFVIELDASLLKEGKLERYLAELGVEKAETFSSVEDFVVRSARHIVPMEIVVPPVPVSRLPDIERLRAALSASAAKDTRASIFHAFGTHLNPGVPSFEVDEIRDVLRAFLILYEWLKEKLDVNISRRLTPFIDPFPCDYARLVLAPDYAPDLETLIRDYVRYNPTRNRPLDMLPLFAYLREELVFEDFAPKLVSPRPAYHYRLPNCSLNDPAWTLASEWNRWVVVERVAADKERLAHLAESWLHWLDHPAQVVVGRIAAKIREWFA